MSSRLLDQVRARHASPETCSLVARPRQASPLARFVDEQIERWERHGEWTTAHLRSLAALAAPEEASDPAPDLARRAVVARAPSSAGLRSPTSEAASRPMRSSPARVAERHQSSEEASPASRHAGAVTPGARATPRPARLVREVGELFAGAGSLRSVGAASASTTEESGRATGRRTLEVLDDGAGSTERAPIERPDPARERRRQLALEDWRARSF